MQDSDLVRFAARFEGRKGVYARMWHHRDRGSGYSPVHAPLDAEAVRAHLQGRVTLGAYLVRADDSAEHGVLDIDATPDALRAASRDRRAANALRDVTHQYSQRLRSVLEAAGLRPMLVDSGYKGRHLWCFLEAPVPAARVRAVLSSLVARVQPAAQLRVEVFPKQDRVRSGGLGNLVKLPLGVHLRTGRLAEVLDSDGAPIPDGLRALLAWPRSSLPRGSGHPRGEPTPTRTDEETDPPLAAALLQSCAMVRSVFARAIEQRAISTQGRIVLQHTLGYLHDGLPLLRLLPRSPRQPIPGRPLSGYPIGCARIRRRLPALAHQLPCDCVFPDDRGAYAHPLRHLEDPPPQGGGDAPCS